MISLVAMVGGHYLLDTQTFSVRMEAERVAENIRWAQSYAISHGYSVIMLFAGQQYSLFTQRDGQPIAWSALRRSCEQNVCRLDPKLYFPAQLSFIIDQNGGFNYLESEQPTRTAQAAGRRQPLLADDYYLRIPLVEIPSTTPSNLDAYTDNFLFIVLSTLGGTVKVMDWMETSTL